VFHFIFGFKLLNKKGDISTTLSLAPTALPV